MARIPPISPIRAIRPPTGPTMLIGFAPNGMPKRWSNSALMSKASVSRSV